MPIKGIGPTRWLIANQATLFEKKRIQEILLRAIEQEEMSKTTKAQKREQKQRAKLNSQAVVRASERDIVKVRIDPNALNNPYIRNNLVEFSKQVIGERQWMDMVQASRTHPGQRYAIAVPANRQLNHPSFLIVMHTNTVNVGTYENPNLTVPGETVISVQSDMHGMSGNMQNVMVAGGNARIREFVDNLPPGNYTASNTDSMISYDDFINARHYLYHSFEDGIVETINTRIDDSINSWRLDDRGIHIMWPQNVSLDWTPTAGREFNLGRDRRIRIVSVRYNASSPEPEVIVQPLNASLGRAYEEARYNAERRLQQQLNPQPNPYYQQPQAYYRGNFLDTETEAEHQARLAQQQERIRLEQERVAQARAEAQAKEKAERERVEQERLAALKRPAPILKLKHIKTR